MRKVRLEVTPKDAEEPPKEFSKTRRSRVFKLPEGQACFAVFELARIFGVQRSHVLGLIEEGLLAGAIDLRGKGASRACIRVPRQSVLDALESGSIRIQGAV